MKKKNFKMDAANHFIYLPEKTCRYCGTPLPGDSTARRDFCPITYDQNGNTRDCKSAYHREKGKPDRDMLASITANHKAICSRIEYLINTIGQEVTTKDLDTYKINLIECIEAKKLNGLTYWYFIKHVIVNQPFSNLHKIERHDKYTNNGPNA
jgi:hypothetical protein